MASIFVPSFYSHWNEDDFLRGNGMHSFQSPVRRMRTTGRRCLARPTSTATTPVFGFILRDEDKDDKNFRVAIDLKGFSDDNIKVDLDKKSRVMTVIAEEQKGGFIRRFRKTLALPENLDENRVNAVLENGVLTLTSEGPPQKSEADEVAMEETEVNEKEVAVEDLGVDEEDDNKSETLSDESVFVLERIAKEPFHIKVNLEGFRKEHVSVESFEDGVKVVAKSQETAEDGGIVEKNFVKKYPVKKEEFDIQQMTWQFNDEEADLLLTIPPIYN